MLCLSAVTKRERYFFTFSLKKFINVYFQGFSFIFSKKRSSQYEQAKDDVVHRQNIQNSQRLDAYGIPDYTLSYRLSPDWQWWSRAPNYATALKFHERLTGRTAIYIDKDAKLWRAFCYLARQMAFLGFCMARIKPVRIREDPLRPLAHQSQ